MSNRPLNSHGRVECIKQKFESSFLQQNTLSSKTKSGAASHSAPSTSSNSKKNVSPHTANDYVNKNDSRVLVKRTPAFRREKVKCLKSGGKMPCLKKENSTPSAIATDSICTPLDKERLSISTKGSAANLPDNHRRENQRAKTYLFDAYDNRNTNYVNSIKSALTSKQINIVKNDENTINDKIVPYATVNKNFKKKVENKKEEIDIILSESLKKALQSPLPEGPPPKKPPRTFCHMISDGKFMPPKDDISKLKYKLEKLEHIIKCHERGHSVTAPNKEYGQVPEVELKSIPKTIESTNSSNISKMKSDNQTCLQFPSCINSCTSDYMYDKFFCKKDLGNMESGRQSTENSITSFNDKKKMENRSEPIYDKPFFTKTSNDTHQKFSEVNKSDTNSIQQEGLHYMCTDLVKKLNSDNPFESLSNRNFVQNEKNHCVVASENSMWNFPKELNQSSSSNLFTSDCVIEPAINLASCEKFYSKDEKNSNESLFNENGSKSETDSWSEDSECDWNVISQEPLDLYSKDRRQLDERHYAMKTAGTVPSSVQTNSLNHATRGASELFNPLPYWKCVKEGESPRLFECCLLVGLTLENEKNIPYIKTIFPSHVKPPPLIEALCFPDATNWPSTLGNDQPEEQYYSLVVTNENGERKFGYCRRVLPEGGNICLPLTYCIITSYRANGFFYKILQELESRHGSFEIDNFMKQLYEAEFPGPGEGLKLKKILKLSNSDKEDYLSSTLVRRPCDVRLEEKDLTQLFQHLQLPVFLKVFSSLLHERKVLLLSSSLRKLSSCIEALQSILLPFLWQHTYIPVLPVHLLEMCEAPTPYVIGLLKLPNGRDSLSNFVFENGIMVDLDDSKILKCCGDEGNILPPRLTRSLKTSLSLAVNATVLSDSNRNVLISDAFIGFFVQVCGHFSKFISNIDGQKAFDRKGFIKFVSSTTIQVFLEWFSETAMFQAFIQKRLHGAAEDVPAKLFSLRAMEYPMEAMKNSAGSTINYKVINKKVKSISDKIKDLIQ